MIVVDNDRMSAFFTTIMEQARGHALDGSRGRRPRGPLPPSRWAGETDRTDPIPAPVVYEIRCTTPRTGQLRARAGLVRGGKQPT